MNTVRTICDYLEEFAPSRLAEDWDNVGLLVGDPERPVERVMTCLTITRESAEEAIERGADLIVAHHPLPFRPLQRITTETVPGRLLWQLIHAGISVASPHTAFDSAVLGINQMLAEGLGLAQIRPLVPAQEVSSSQDGAGRWGHFDEPLTLSQIADRLKAFLGIDSAQYVGDIQRTIQTAAVACGSAGEFLDEVRRAGCELLVTGETSFHTCLAAAADDVCLLLPGHFASERFAVERLAAILENRFSDLRVWCSRRESDPLRWI